MELWVTPEQGQVIESPSVTLWGKEPEEKSHREKQATVYLELKSYNLGSMGSRTYPNSIPICRVKARGCNEKQEGTIVWEKEKKFFSYGC